MLDVLEENMANMKETETINNYWLIVYYESRKDYKTLANTVTTLDPADWLLAQYARVLDYRHYIYVVNAFSITKQQYDRLDKKLPDM